MLLLRPHPTAGVLLDFVTLWLILDRTAAVLGSLRGEAGIFVCAVVLIAAAMIEMLLAGRKPLAAWRALGLRMAGTQALLWSPIIAAGLLCLFTPSSRVRSSSSMWARSAFLDMAIAWMVVSAVSPWVFFLMRPTTRVEGNP